MSIQTIEDTKVKAFPAKPAELVTFTAKARRRVDPLAIAGKLATALVPPAVVILVLLVVWQVACSSPTSSLPPPSQVWNEAYDLIAHPFFDNGPQDIGLAWRVLISLQRVAIGFGMAAVVGVALGALVGQSVWAMRGLDPVFQILRTVPPLAWLPLSLAAFRDSSPSALFVIFITSIWPIIINTAVGVRNIPQDYRNVARILRLNPFEFFVKIMVPAAPLHLHRSAHRHRPVLARHRRRRNADRRRRHRLLHLGRLELVAAARHHRRARLYRRHRLLPRPAGRGGRRLCHPRHNGKMRRAR